MTVSEFEGSEAGIHADVRWRLVDAETESGNFDCGVVERKEVCEGNLGGRHDRLGVRIVVCFSFRSAFVRGLELGGQGPVVRMDVSTELSQSLGSIEEICWLIGLTFAENDS